MEYAPTYTDYVSYYMAMGWATIASFGWYFVALLVALAYYYPSIQEKYKKWKLKRDEQEYAAKYHKDTDLLQRTLSGLEASRQKMQEQYEKTTVLAAAIKKEQEEKKREEYLKSINENYSGERLGGNDTVDKGTKPKTYKPEYNPLTGDTSRGYRPPKRSCCGKGGCN